MQAPPKPGTRAVGLALTPLAVLLALLAIAPSAQAFINNSPNLPQAQDTNSDPRIFETTITAAETQENIFTTSLCFTDVCRVPNALTFNGLIPGPEIRVKQHDRVIVNFRNNMPASMGNASIHWHGIELTNPSDGTAVNQNPVRPGGTYRYNFTVPRPGVYWFHTHMSPTNHAFKGLYGSLIVTSPEDTKLQSNFTLPPASLTKTLVLSDVTLCKSAGSNDNQTFPTDSSLPWAGDTNFDGGRDAFPGKFIGPSPRELCEAPIDNHGARIFGPLPARAIPNVQYDPEHCPNEPPDPQTNQFKTNQFINLSKPCSINEGQDVVVNGRLVAPRGGSPDGGSGPADVADTPDVLQVRPGATYRLQLIDAALSRYFRLHLRHRTSQVTLFRIGGEGGLLNNTLLEGGRNATPKYLAARRPSDGAELNSAGNPQILGGEVVLAPGQRSDVLFTVPGDAVPGELLTLWTRDFQRGLGNDGRSPLEKSPTGPCPLGTGRCGPNGYSLVPTVPVLHMRVVGGGTGPLSPSARAGAPLLTHSTVNRPLEDLRRFTATRLLTPTEAGQSGGLSPSFGATIQMQMGRFDDPDLAGMQGTFHNHRPMVDSVIGMLDDNRTGVHFTQIHRPSTTRYLRLGEVIELTVRNTTGMNHPFHLHGASFQPIRLEANPACTGEDERTPTRWRVYDYVEHLDTYDIPACTQIVLRVQYDDRPKSDNAPGGALGRWVWHCHIFEHAADGMMSEVDVLPPAGPKFFGLRTRGTLARGATVIAKLRKRRLLLLDVRRVVKRRARGKRHARHAARRRSVRVGLVRLGRRPKGRSRIHWNLRVRRRPLRPGRYQVTLHSRVGGLLSTPAPPGARTLVVQRGGRVRTGGVRRRNAPAA